MTMLNIFLYNGETTSESIIKMKQFVTDGELGNAAELARKILAEEFGPIISKSPFTRQEIVFAYTVIGLNALQENDFELALCNFGAGLALSQSYMRLKLLLLIAITSAKEGNIRNAQNILGYVNGVILLKESSYEPPNSSFDSVKALRLECDQIRDCYQSICTEPTFTKEVKDNRSNRAYVFCELADTSKDMTEKMAYYGAAFALTHGIVQLEIRLKLAELKLQEGNGKEALRLLKHFNSILTLKEGSKPETASEEVQKIRQAYNTLRKEYPNILNENKVHIKQTEKFIPVELKI